MTLLSLFQQNLPRSAIHTSKARIVPQPRTQSALSRIQASPTATQSAVARIAFSNLQSATARMAGITTGAPTSNSGVNVNTITVNVANAGDALALFVSCPSTVTLNAISGGGTWPGGYYASPSVGGYHVYGTYTTATVSGSTTITVTYSGTPGANCDLVCYDLVPPPGFTVWGLVTSQTQGGTGSSPTGSMTASSDQYQAATWYGYGANQASPGADSRTTYTLVSSGNDGIVGFRNYLPWWQRYQWNWSQTSGSYTTFGQILAVRPAGVQVNTRQTRANISAIKLAALPWSGSGLNLSSLGLGVGTVSGDRVVVAVKHPSSVTVTGMTFTQGVMDASAVATNVDSTNGTAITFWLGVATSAASGTFSWTYSSTPGAYCDAYTCRLMLPAGAGVSWSLSTQTAVLTNQTGTDTNYPSITTDLSVLHAYIGLVASGSTSSAGTTLNCRYTTSTSTVLVVNTNIPANAAYQPTASQSSSTWYDSLGIVLAGVVLTNTQTATARIAPYATQTARAKIGAAGSSKTQTAVARVQGTRSKTQSAVARISKSVQKTQSVAARIAQTGVQATQSAAARIARSITATTTAVARAAKTVTKTQTAGARIAVVTTQTQTATARLKPTITRTQAAAARTSAVVTRTQTAVARASTSRTRTQAAVARVAVVATRTQTAAARIKATLTQTHPAVAEIAKTVSKTQTATSRIAKTVSKTQTAVTRVRRTFTATQTAQSRIVRNPTATTTATTRISKSNTATQTAVTRIALNLIPGNLLTLAQQEIEDNG